MMQGVSGVLPPDLSQFFALDLAGVEYYSSAGSIPLKYKTVRSNCGAILFWTRAK